MAASNLTIPVSSELEARVQLVLDDFGMDLTTAVSSFLEQLAIREPVCFTIVRPANNVVRPPFNFGKLKGQIWMSEDFDAPLEDFGENITSILGG